MNRNEIITRLTQLLKNETQIYALWLEGADAIGNVDEYSDIDYCLCADAAAVDSITDILKHNFDTDRFCVSKQTEAEMQIIFHITDTSRFLTVDFNIYFYGIADITFINNDIIDACKVLIDKEHIIRFEEYDPEECADMRKYWKEESAKRFLEWERVEKYCLRDKYPEAYVYYQKYVVEPIVYLLRIRYTPTKMYYYLIHISDHIPKDELHKLNRLLQAASCNDILANIDFAKTWYQELTMVMEN